MMGLESDPKDGKVVAGSIFWAVIVYAVRASPSFLWWPRPPLPGCGGGRENNNKANSGGCVGEIKIGIPRVLRPSSAFTFQSE